MGALRIVLYFLYQSITRITAFCLIVVVKPRTPITGLYTCSVILNHQLSIVFEMFAEGLQHCFGSPALVFS